MQKVCGIKCALAYAEAHRTAAAKRERAAERKQLREAKQKAKTRSQWMKEAQAEFNRWVRSRDAEKPCISCGRGSYGQAHAGHFFSVGARPGLRFNEANVHLQCALCNVHLHGNLINYRIGLIARIGLAAVEELEADQSTKHYSIEDLKAIKAEYTRKRRELEASK